MKTIVKKSFISFLLLTIPFLVSAQKDWKEDSVTLKGKIIGYQNFKNPSTVNFIFRDIISRDLQKVYVAEIDSSGNFLIKITISFPQMFFLKYDDINSKLFCAAGDSLSLEINPKDKTVDITSGNRINDNRDIKSFFKGLENIDNNPVFDLAKNKTSKEFSNYLSKRKSLYQAAYIDFKKLNNTSSLFNRFAEDYITYENLNALLSYPNWHSIQNEMQKDSVELEPGYYSFLNQYDMNDVNIHSTEHFDFLNSFYRYVLSTPKDSINKANRDFKNGNIIAGGKTMKNMILNSTTGFTRDLFMTKLFLDAIEGKQIRVFEAVYDSSDITGSYFKKIVADAYQQLKDFMLNKKTTGANLQSIDSKSTKDLVKAIATKYSNKVIYIDFWAPWCVPCLEEMPYSKKIQQEYKNKNVVFLFLANRCAKDAWEATIANLGLTGEHILLTDDQFNSLAAEFNILGIPHYLLIDKKGNIVLKDAPRPSRQKQVESEIDRLLQ